MSFTKRKNSDVDMVKLLVFRAIVIFFLSYLSGSMFKLTLNSFQCDTQNFAGILNNNLYISEDGEARLIQENVNTSGLTWSPDGTMLAFTYPSEKNGSSQISIYHEETNTIAQVTTANYNHVELAWSPDSWLLAYTKVLRYEGEIPAESEIWVFYTDFPNNGDQYNVQASLYEGQNNRPHWTIGDFRYLAFRHNESSLYGFEPFLKKYIYGDANDELFHHEEQTCTNFAGYSYLVSAPD